MIVVTGTGSTAREADPNAQTSVPVYIHNNVHDHTYVHTGILPYSGNFCGSNFCEFCRNRLRLEIQNLYYSRATRFTVNSSTGDHHSSCLIKW